MSWQDIDAWHRRTGIELDPWESRLMRLLSAEYLAESHRARADDAAPPWLEGDEEIAGYRKARSAARLKAEMRAAAAT